MITGPKERFLVLCCVYECKYQCYARERTVEETTQKSYYQCRRSLKM